MAKAMHTSFKTIEEWQENLSGTVTDLLKALCKAIEDAKIAVNCPVPTTESLDPPEISKIEQTATPVLDPAI